MKMAVNILTETVAVSSRILVDISMSVRETAVGLVFTTLNESQEPLKKTLFITANGFKKFLKYRSNVLNFFHKALSKENVDEFVVVIEERKNGVVKLNLHKYLETPYCSLTFYKGGGDIPIEKMTPTGYMVVMNAEDVIALYEKHATKILECIEKLEDHRYTPIIFEYMAKRIFNKALEIHQSLNLDKSPINLNIREVINTYYKEIQRKCLKTDEDEGISVSSAIMTEIEIKLGTTESITEKDINHYIQVFFAKEKEKYLKVCDKLYSAWMFGVLAEQDPKQQQQQQSSCNKGKEMEKQTGESITSAAAAA